MQSPPPAWRSRLGRRVAALFTVAALIPAIVLAVLSFREITDETSALNHKNRFQFTKAGALYFHGWMTERARTLTLAIEDWERHAADGRPTDSERRLPSGVLRIATEVGLSKYQRDLLAERRIVVSTQAISANMSRVQLFQRALGTPRATLFAFELTGTPDLGVVLPPEYRYCLRNEVQAYVFCSAPPPADWERSVTSTPRSAGYQEGRVATAAGDTQVATWRLFMDESFGVGDWQIVTWQTGDYESFSPAYFLRTNAPIFGFSVIIVLLLTLIALRRSLAPIRGLTDFAEEMTKGNLRARIELKTGDEIERLGNSFNQMASQLERHFKALEDSAAIDHAILASFDAHQIVALILRHVFAQALGDAVAVALKSEGEITYGLKSLAVEKFDQALDDSGFDTLCRTSHPLELETAGAWARSLRALGAANALVIARQVEMNYGVVLVIADVNGGHLTSQNETALNDFADRIALALSNRAIQQKVAYQTYHDALTELPNREHLLAGLKSTLTLAQDEQASAALLVIDLDDFKAFNDSLGYAAGDAMLCQIADRLRTLAIPPCQAVRLRGDKFAILVPALPPNEGAAVARIRELTDTVHAAVSAPLITNEACLRLSASIGAALYPRDAADGEALLKCAESAVEQAKTAVVNQRFRFYSEELNTRTLRSLALRNALRQAIDERAFVLHYQPKVDAKSSRVVGCEALVRWQHPERGLVMPGEFIVEAEQSGLIVELGQLVLEQACRQLRQWRDRHGLENFKMNVNLAARQFEAPDLVTRVAACLRATAIPAAAIELEITETVACADMSRTIEYMERLRAIGLSLALDDFGTGHSSLKYLQRMPIQVIKIDRSFVIEIGKGSKGEAVIDSILTLCRRLGMHSVAEGVETSEQCDYLRAHDCDLIQGYLFSRPLPAEVFETYLIQDLARRNGDPDLPHLRAVGY
ncbi:MAG: EAL domain-containing protein [Gammaproteobacteria bacterium]|nr:EAL domain-containing protein [Gammaproteobacteria bacterium]